MLALVVYLTQAWTALYTRGLPETLRNRRREEIDCDLWEHQRLADLERTPATSTAFEILLRLLLGLPADVIWRLEAGASARSRRGTEMNESWIMRGVLAGALLVALVPLGLGLFYLAGGGEWGSTLERIFGSFFWMAIGLALSAGLLLSRSRPVLGLCLLAVGVITISTVLYWAAVITLPIGLVLLAVAYFRARSPGWRRRGNPA